LGAGVAPVPAAGALGAGAEGAGAGGAGGVVAPGLCAIVNWKRKMKRNKNIVKERIRFLAMVKQIWEIFYFHKNTNLFIILNYIKSTSEKELITIILFDLSFPFGKLKNKK
jgi:hypothetical protein